MKNRLSALLLVSLSTTSVSFAIDYTRTASGTASLWSDTSLWTPTGTPGAADNATFTVSGSSTVTIDGAYSVNNLLVDGAGGTTLTFQALNTNGTYSLSVAGTLGKSSNTANLAFSNQASSSQRLDVSIGKLDLAVNGGSVSFGRSDGGRRLNNLTVGETVIGGGGGSNGIQIYLNLSNHYSLGALTFNAGNNVKSVYLITNAADSAGYARTATVTGITDASSNSTIYGSRNTSTSNNGATLLVNTAAGTAYSANTTLADGTGGTLALLKQGAGSQTLLGANTYTGATTVDAGLLATGATGTFGAGDVRVAAATLTLGNAASVADTATLFFNASSTVDLSFTGTEVIGSLVNEAGGASAGPGLYTAEQLNAFFNVSVFTGAGQLNVLSAIPEPSTYSVLGGVLALAAALLSRRRR